MNSSLVIALGIGYILGVLVCAIVTAIHQPKPDGVFRINLSDPMKDTFRLELSRPIEGIQNCKRLYFVVVDDTEKSREKQSV